MSGGARVVGVEVRSGVGCRLRGGRGGSQQRADSVVRKEWPVVCGRRGTGHVRTRKPRDASGRGAGPAPRRRDPWPDEATGKENEHRWAKCSTGKSGGREHAKNGGWSRTVAQRPPKCPDAERESREKLAKERVHADKQRAGHEAGPAPGRRDLSPASTP